MNDINRYVCTGRLTRDAELRSTATGTEVLNMRIAVNDRRRNNQTGEWEDYPNFIGCKMFGTRAGKVAPMLSKGMKVTIEGKLSYSEWKDKDGRDRSAIEVLVDNIGFTLQKPAPDRAPEPEYYDVDLPF